MTETTFEALGLSPTLLSTLQDLEYATPTPIQEQAIPALLAGRDVIGQAQTGTGKTAAFTLPLLQNLEAKGLQMLVLTPTRELAIQVAEAVYRYGSQQGTRVLPIYGGESYERQERRLRKGVHVVVGTPGRTLDLIRKKTLDLSNVRYVVLDEADEMLRMGFIEDVESILSATDVEARQTALFSATFADEIRKLANKYMRDPQHITIEATTRTADKVNQRHYMVGQRDKLAALCRILEVEDYQNALIFTRTRVGAAELAEELAERGFGAIAIHGDLAQNERERILRRFKEGTLSILVGTDVVGRGMDIPDVSHVVNYDVPQLAVEYIHRIGRTARAGRSGEALTFITPKQRHTLHKIENYIQTKIPKAQLPSREDVIQHREQQFSVELLARIAAITEADPLLDELEKTDYSVEQIISGLVQLLREKDKHYAINEVKAPREKQDKRERRDRRDRGSNKPPRGRKGKGKRRHEPGMVRLRMDVGRANGVQPGEIVRIVASKAKIPGSSIGAIDIHQDKTYVDVPEAHVEVVLKRIGRGTIRGQALNLVRD